jgi:rod shape-determining protein MreD
MERLGGFFHSRFLPNCVPVLFAFLGVLLTNTPVAVFGIWVPAPMYALMPVYYWCLVRPDLMSPGWVLLIGLGNDVLSPAPVGVWAASFVLTYAVLDKQRDAFAGLSGWGAILGFATTALIACTANYSINSILAWKLLPMNDTIKEFAVTSMMYGFALPVLGIVHRKVVGPLRSEF